MSNTITNPNFQTADDYPDTDTYLEQFTEWIGVGNGCPEQILAKAQAGSYGFVHARFVYDSTTEEWCEHVHNDLDAKSYDSLMGHLAELLADDYQGRDGYWVEASDWAHAWNDDFAADFCEVR